MDGFWPHSWLYLAVPGVLCALCYALSYWYWARTTIPVQYVACVHRLTFSHQYLVRLIFQDPPSTSHGRRCKVETTVSYGAAHQRVTLHFALNRIFHYRERPTSLLLLRSAYPLADLMTVQFRLLCPSDCAGLSKTSIANRRSSSSLKSSDRLELLQICTFTVQHMDQANQLEVKKPLSTMRFHGSPKSTRLHVTVERKSVDSVWLREEYRYPLALERAERMDKDLVRGSLVCPTTAFLVCQLASVYLNIYFIADIQAQLFADWYPNTLLMVLIQCIMASVFITVFVYLFALYAFVVAIQEQLLIMGSMAQNFGTRLLHSAILLAAILASLACGYLALCRIEHSLDSISRNSEFAKDSPGQYWHSWQIAFFASLAVITVLQGLLVAFDYSPCGLLAGHYSPCLDGQCRTCHHLYRSLPGTGKSPTSSLLMMLNSNKVGNSFNRIK